MAWNCRGVIPPPALDRPPAPPALRRLCWADACAICSPCRSSCWQLTRKSTHGRKRVITSSVLVRMCRTTSFPDRGVRDTAETVRETRSRSGSICADGSDE